MPSKSCVVSKQFLISYKVLTLVFSTTPYLYYTLATKFTMYNISPTIYTPNQLNPTQYIVS